ncbi:MAG: hypothetical protein ABJJ53_10995 [Sulfitobacter sp.]
MNTPSEIAKIQKLVDLKYHQQQESFSRLLAQENRLRGSLFQLDQQLSDSRNTTDTQQQAIGADILWQAWIGRKKRDLNLQLAQVLSVKERHIEQVRSAYGKVVVAEQLYQQACDKRKDKMAQFELNRAISLLLY